MTFEEAWNYVCRRCGKKAAHHRMTSHGKLYCLMPGYHQPRDADIRRMRKHEPTIRAEDVVLNTCPVDDLRRSPIPQEVGHILAESMVSYLSSSI